MKITSSSILKVCLGISAIILSAAAFNLTISKAHAEPKTIIDQSSAQFGKYTVSMAVSPAGDQNLWSIVVMDTETGKCKAYYDKESNSFGPSFYVNSTNPAGN